MPIPSTAFAVRFSYGSGPTIFDFPEPALLVSIKPRPIAAGNRVFSGKTEWLYGRREDILMLSWGKLPKASIESLFSWWDSIYSQGKQTAITLDRLGTATDQAEYAYNTFFTKAEPPDLTIPEFPVGRTVLERAFYTFGPIGFRQGQ